MTQPNNGGPAFPQGGEVYQAANGRGGYDAVSTESHNGLSKREYIAIKAMQGMLSHDSSVSNAKEAELLADISYKIADALIAESEKDENHD